MVSVRFLSKPQAHATCDAKWRVSGTLAARVAGFSSSSFTPPSTNTGSRWFGSDSSGMMWMVATGVQPNVFVGFNPETEEFFGETEIPSGGGTVRHMHYHEPTGMVWFGTDTNYIGRAVVEPDK